ncbi:hypothetical protein PRIPAC_96708 [Pristionchus pacificus]|uniref:Uncharacterized protein n=1 Tax=Pristionchus pacificus TaxID=54126 RepID=A0A2A6BD49_PRIPA|nr:hypothetical protein PRIPAC_96708 [Pristionchus pacificus]|eukprot:PDM63799.1 hypothetical protein PRIPAC_49772 [Pristionchus pacificus]
MGRHKRSREQKKIKDDDEVKVTRVVKPNPLRKPKKVKIYVKDEPKEFWAENWANPEELAPEDRSEKKMRRREEKRRKKEMKDNRDIEVSQCTPLSFCCVRTFSNLDKANQEQEKKVGQEKKGEKKAYRLAIFSDHSSRIESFPTPSIYGPIYRPLSWSFRGPDKDRYYYDC